MAASDVRSPGVLRMPSQGALLGLVVLFAALTGLGFLISRRLTSGAPAAEPVTAQVGRQNLSASVSTTGTVVSTATSKLAFKASGRIAEVLVSVGDQVTAGQILARQDASDLEPAVLQAQANLKANEAKLAAMLEGPKREDVIAAQASLDAANAKLGAMQAGSREDELAAAQAGLDSAALKLGVLLAPSPEDVTIAQGAVTSAAASLDSARSKYEQVKAGPAEADRIAAQAALSAAHAARASAYAKVFDGHDSNASPSDRISNTASLASAEAALKSAEAKYQQTLQGPTETDILAAQKDVTVGEIGLRSAQAKLTQLLYPDQSAVVSAQATLLQAQSTLGSKLSPYTDADFAAQQQAIKSAQANLAAKREPYQPSDILAAEAAVVKSQADLATAQANLGGSTLIAPFTGVVSAVNMSVGETAITSGGNTSSSLTVVDPSQVRVDVQVDEADIAQVEVGQQAQLTFDALPGRALQGRVMAVAPSGTLTQGVVGYPVAIELRNARGVRAGMTATAEVVHQRKDNVLSVPNRAIVRQGRDRFVDVITPTGTQRKKIEVGMANDQFTEIISGLAEGETVVIPQTTARANIPGGGAIVGGGPGGPGGGGLGGTFVAPAP